MIPSHRAQENAMQEPNNSSFFDPKTITAVILVGIVWFGWQSYLTKKYPQHNKPAVTSTETAGGTVVPSTTPGAVGSPDTTASGGGDAKAIPSVAAKELNFQDEHVSFTITSHGMGLKNYTLNKYVNYDQSPIKLGVSDSESLFEMKLAGPGKPLDFDLKEESPGQFVGVAQVGQSTITRTFSYDHEKQAFRNRVDISNVNEQMTPGIAIVIPEKITAKASKSFLFPSYEHQDFFVEHANTHDLVNFSAAKENVDKNFPQATLLSAGSQYFAAAILDKSEIIPSAILSSDIAQKSGKAELLYKPIQAQGPLSLEQIIYAGPKSIDILKAVDPRMTSVIDHGFFGFIARPLLYVMKAFYSVIGNWGLAIICLTLLVRLCVLPFAIMSARSMKAMQKIQPHLAALREKYKADPMTLNKETYALMKVHKANPVGGCLPMLLQIPVFFALYRVIGSSIELYHSPFAGWITDLSSPDRFYVLPVIMGVAMFAQQKLTPTTMDPAQAKIMAFLPLVFSVFMLQLPSGLTLYMCVSTLFGITQQMIFLRDTKKVTA
jgi:YidC/Oxa1 family membrane protein insertase